VSLYRERALARKNVVSLEAEVAEAGAQLASLEEMRVEVRERLDGVEKQFADGRVSAPIAGVVSTNLAHLGQSLVAGTAIAEILDPREVFVDWYIPNERFRDPKAGDNVAVEILPVSDVYVGKQLTFTRDRAASQIARVHFSAGQVPPAMNSTVYVRMYYSDFASRTTAALVRMIGLY
jgi:multidrug resistance efflux pump